jgi:hypothetical protein
VPPEWWPSALPASPHDYWAWVLNEGLVNGPIDRYTGARHASTVRTYLHLREAGFPCELTNELRTGGVVITHTDFLPRRGGDNDPPWDRPGKFERWMSSTFVVCYQADRPRHPYAHLHVVQNGEDANRYGTRRLARWAQLRLHYIPLWTQPNLLARADERGDEFGNVTYFGIEGELDPSLREPAWRERLHDEGFNFTVAPAESWSDYRDVDVVLAARSFTYPGAWYLKPPSKLFNAWLAGVPAILGRESAYRAERRSELDFIEVVSREHVEDALVRLRDDLRLRKAMVENGHTRAEGVSDDAITAQWIRFIENEVTPAYNAWKASSSSRRVWATVKRAAYVKADSVVGPMLQTRRTVRGLWHHRGDWR